MKFFGFLHESLHNFHRKRAISWYFISLLILVIGLYLSARDFPGGFDWVYIVASALASQKHNPTGSMWFSAFFFLSMLLLWPFVSELNKELEPSLSKSQAIAVVALRIGIVCGALLGLERLLIYDLSAKIDRAHEFLGLFTLIGFYYGILSLLILSMHRHKIYILPVLLIVFILFTIGISQTILYLEQRDIGWVDASWREIGIHFWYSFAFWQWLGIVVLWIGLAMLPFSCSKEKN